MFAQMNSLFHKVTRDETCANTHLIDVLEFVYDLADDWLRRLVASGL